jgi:hypothetical protein
MLLQLTAIGLALVSIEPPFSSPTRSHIPPHTQIVLANKARTVTDYFLQTPDRYFKILERDRVTPAIRRQLLTKSGNTIDPSNGYLAVSSIAPDLCRYEMAIFKRARGSHLVALNISCTVGDTLTIIDPDRSWQDVTATVFPANILAPSTNQTIRLPRQGRTISIADENNRQIAKIDFQNDRFKLVK